MVSSHSSTELQLLKSGIALSIRGGLFRLRLRDRWPEMDGEGGRWMGQDKQISSKESENQEKVRKGAQSGETRGKRGA